MVNKIKMEQYQVPILFIIFRRKDVALSSFERIKSIRPAKLYIACDGPRNNVEGEKELVDATRKAILNQVDWDCEVKTLFQRENLGCSQPLTGFSRTKSVELFLKTTVLCSVPSFHS